MKKILALSLLACLPLCGCPPVVVETNAPPAAVEVDAAPADADFYFVGGQYYYWHPGYNRWVAYHGVPPHDRVIRRYNRLPNRPVRRQVRAEHREEHHDEHR